MPTIPVYLSKELHKKLHIKLYQNDRTMKEFFLTAAQNYVNADDEEKINDVEKPENPEPAVKVDRVDDPIEPEEENIEPENRNKKPKEKIKHGKKIKSKTKTRTRAGTGNKGTRGRNPKKRPSRVSVKKDKRGTGQQDPGPRKKRGIWPWVR